MDAGKGVFADEPPRVRVEVLDDDVRRTIEYDPGLPEVESAPAFDRKGSTFLEAVMLGAYLMLAWMAARERPP